MGWGGAVSLPWSPDQLASSSCFTHPNVTSDWSLVWPGRWGWGRVAAGPLREQELHPSKPAAASLPGLTVETGGPETEINCQVSGEEWGACQPLCFLAQEVGAGSNSRPCPRLLLLRAIFPQPPDALTPMAEARLSLEFGRLVNPEGPGIWI